MEGTSHTITYFDNHIQKHSASSARFVINWLQCFAKPGESLVDIGCGTGKILATIQKETALEVCGIDGSPACVRSTAALAGCEALQGSIIDDEFIARIGQRFDYAILAAVLHHVIGKTRRESKELAKKALENSLQLLKPDGKLFVLEPTFTPRLTMDLVFWVKRAVTIIATDRVQLGAFNNNIGAPVVSYYGSDELTDLIPPQARMIDKEVLQSKPIGLFRLAGIQRSQTTLVIQKP